MFNLAPKILEIQVGEFILRTPKKSDMHQWLSVRNRNFHQLQQWEGAWDNYPLSTRDFEFYRNRVSNNDKACGFCIFAPQNRLIGGINLNNMRFGMVMGAELGYWLDGKYRNQGIMTQCLAKIVEFGFNHHHFHRIEAYIIPENHASRQILLKNGFEFEAMVKEKFCINGQWRDHELYAVVN